MTDVYIGTSTINNRTWYNFTVNTPLSTRDVVGWAVFCEWVEDPIEAMHVLRRDFAGYTLYGDHRHIHIPDRDVALRFAVWLLEWFEKDRITASAKFLEKTRAEILEDQIRQHIYLDYESLGDLDRKRISRQSKEPDTLLIGELGDGPRLPDPPKSRLIKSPY